MSTNQPMLNNPPQSLGNQVYSGTASFGVLVSSFRAVLGTILGILMFIGGVYLTRYRSRMKYITGKVSESSSCNTKYYSTSGSKYNNSREELVCTTPVKYEIKGKKYTHNLTTNSNKYKKGNNIKIWYNPSKPGIPQYSPISIWMGIGLIMLSILIILGSWITVWLTRKYKLYGAVVGGGALGNTFVNLVR